MSQPTTDEKADAYDRVGGVNGSRLIAVLVVAVVVIVGYFALGMPGMGHGGGGMAGMGAMDASDMAVGVDDFAARLADPDVFVVNVHVPDEGSIAGTDVAIPYDRIVGDARLPDDKSTPIALYCKTGRMSAEAATALMDAGFTNVVYLDGGMDAWTAAGRTLD